MSCYILCDKSYQLRKNIAAACIQNHFLEAVGYFAAILIGITLGLIGGGGSILTIPVLVYFFSISPLLATSYSLFIVGIAALAGSIAHYRLGNLQWKPALVFSIPSVTSILIVRKAIMPVIPNHLFSVTGIAITKSMLLMLVFAGLMIAAATAMIRQQQDQDSAAANMWKLFFTGLAVGAVTGFLGAGGGFLIIPALIFFGSLTMKQAVGTSLFIIAVNSIIGFTGDIIQGIVVDYQLLTSLTVLALAGIALGTAVSKKIKGDLLKPVFGWFILLMGVYIILKETTGI